MDLSLPFVPLVFFFRDQSTSGQSAPPSIFLFLPLSARKQSVRPHTKGAEEKGGMMKAIVLPITIGVDLAISSSSLSATAAIGHPRVLAVERLNFLRARQRLEGSMYFT